MKRRRVLGLVTTASGAARITSPTVAQALDETQAQVVALNQRLRVLAQDRERLDKHRVVMHNALMRLQNHWWTRLGEALRIVRAP